MFCPLVKAFAQRQKENSFCLLYLTLILQFQSRGHHKEAYWPQILAAWRWLSWKGAKRQEFCIIPLFPLSIVWEGGIPPAAQDFPFVRGGRAGSSRQEALTFAQHLEVESCLQTPTSAPLTGERSRLGWKPGSESASLDWHIPFCQASLCSCAYPARGRLEESRGSPGEFLCSELWPACQARFLAPCLSFSMQWLEAMTPLVPA